MMYPDLTTENDYEPKKGIEKFAKKLEDVLAWILTGIFMLIVVLGIIIAIPFAAVCIVILLPFNLIEKKKSEIFKLIEYCDYRAYKKAKQDLWKQEQEAIKFMTMKRDLAIKETEELKQELMELYLADDK